MPAKAGYMEVKITNYYVHHNNFNAVDADSGFGFGLVYIFFG